MANDKLPLDPVRIRQQFPAFGRPSLDGFAFFENAGGSYTARQVLNRLENYYRGLKVQPYGVYPASKDAGAAMELAYSKISSALNVSPEWLHFGPSTSANTYVLGHALAGWLKSGDAIVVTNQDHEANSGAWRKLSAMGVDVREWKVDKNTGRLDPAKLDDLLDNKVRMIAYPHASNIVGEINPVAEITAKARTIRAITVVDGVSYAPHGLPDLMELGCDVYLFSAYKVYGPHQGVMAIRPSLAADFPSQGHFFNEGKPRYRLTPAGPDHAQIAAMTGVTDYLETVAEIAGTGTLLESPYRRAHDAMRAQELALMPPLLDWLRKKNNVRLIGPEAPERRAPTFALVHKDAGRDVAERLARHKIMAGGGHFYAYRLMEALNIRPDHGVLRLSFVHYTTPEEIQQLIAALDEEL